MNNKFNLLILLLLCFVAFITALPQRGWRPCPLDQEFTRCGSACPPTCDDRGEPRICTLQCIVGCQCRPGNVLNSAGRCVDPSKC
ncbi:chymotrypsin inhibitor-like [Rhagoletis pomonella]|uniref:chymotrypsin inhibitor-like n=1 Tax=Rhagoletis pomonella TaxID=28610 RepID=UPI0017866E04|nr:chymotrypsin inhibitor-like [Rhagoletis pomonella]XP_036331826.1 chymotrypsin inhibitor-like [Rhagoletis pomonella]